MPVDYSKWDALELSDDSDIEVHPNVDKRSFIRAKQNQIHQERQQRKHHIETLKYERIINDALIKRISSLLTALKDNASEAQTRNPGEVAFQAVMMSAATLDPKDDQPPPRPAGIHNAEEPLPSYTKMMATLLDQVNKALDEKKVEQSKRYDGMVAEIGDHLKKVTDLQAELHTKLAELEHEESRKITSESIHTGFDSSHINKSTTASGSGSGKVELLNPQYADATALPAASSSTSKPAATATTGGADADADDEDDDDDEEISASPLARQFARIPAASYRDSLAFLSQHPEILTEKETDGLLVLAFDAQLEEGTTASKRSSGYDARNCVHQALLLQYCRALGRDGVALFFKRIATPGHQAQEVFHRDVRDTYARIQTRAREIVLQRAKDEAEGKGGEGGGVEQIQLHAVEPGTVIKMRIPEAGSEDPEVKKGRKIFEGFAPDMRRALESGSLDKVNKVLGKMGVEEAEELVGLLGEANILSLEEEIIDATTEEGKDKLKKIEEEGKQAKEEREAECADDPE